MNQKNLLEVDWSKIPAPTDDGAAAHLEGMTLIPLKLYFNESGRAKLLLAVAKGKKLHDKRESEKKRDWSREKGRLLRARG